MLTAFVRFLEWLWRKIAGTKPKPDGGLLITHIRHMEGQVERYRLLWIPSASDFVETRDVLCKIDGGAEQAIATGLPSSANQAVYDFPTGAQCEVWTRVHGDNGTQADSAHVTFAATNAEQVEPDTSMTVQWVEHLP